MEKLIELLNESAVLDTIFENECQVKFRATKIISKELGFIKRLVDNDKIDISNFEYTVGTPKIGEDNRDFWYDTYSDLEKVLMLLAISDTPIEDLISYLK